MNRVSIIMGSESDRPIMQQAADPLRSLGVTYEMSVVSAHRTPERMFAYARDVASRGVDVIVAGAGGAAHLPGMVASLTSLPVIGVPIAATKLAGIDSLLSIVQMPKGVPVATVAVDNASNAGLLAARILAISDPDLRSKLAEHRESIRCAVEGQAG